jgi:hypothetical protein
VIRWIKRWLLGEREIVRYGDVYMVRVKILFVNHWVDKKDGYLWDTFAFALGHCAFEDLEQCKSFKDNYTNKGEVIND